MKIFLCMIIADDAHKLNPPRANKYRLKLRAVLWYFLFMRPHSIKDSIGRSGILTAASRTFYIRSSQFPRPDEL